MVFIDTPRRIEFKGRQRLACHCSADSLAELHAFAGRLGAPPRAFEDKPRRPHYDLFDEHIDRAVALGAVRLRNRDFIFRLRRAYGD